MSEPIITEYETTEIEGVEVPLSISVQHENGPALYFRMMVPPPPPQATTQATLQLWKEFSPRFEMSLN